VISHVIVSGEGPSDLGGSRSGEALSYNCDFQKGPFFELIYRMLIKYLPSWNSELFETNPLATAYVSHGYLSQQAKNIAKGKGKFKFAGKSSHKNNAGKFKQSRELAKLATGNSFQLAIYFHDTDGNNAERSTYSNLQPDIVSAVNDGFKKGGHDAGLAMVPKPTSEAWLICNCKSTPYQGCTELEISLSGNDRSPENAPKKVLAAFLGVENCTCEILSDEVQKLDLDKLDMPSFNQFRDDLKVSIKNICGNVEV
jgi:hypothetical protein